MMEANQQIQNENNKLLMEILNLRLNLSELYLQTGPSSPDYISLSLKLDLLINQYFDEKVSKLTSTPMKQLTEIWN
jgi:hypothetical protein